MKISDDQVQNDASVVFDIITQGGIAIVPLDVAYAIIGYTENAIKKIFSAKKRNIDKPSGMFASIGFSLALHHLGKQEREIQYSLINEHNLPFSVVAPFDSSHPLLNDVSPYVLNTSSKAGTIDMLLNAGRFHNALADLSFKHKKPTFGSSANISLTGSKFNVGDIEPELIEIADVVIDHGTSKYVNPEEVSSTIINFVNFTVIRYGCCYSQMEKIFRDQFSIDLKPTN